MRISDWSSDVCSSDLGAERRGQADVAGAAWVPPPVDRFYRLSSLASVWLVLVRTASFSFSFSRASRISSTSVSVLCSIPMKPLRAPSSVRISSSRSEEHTSELQSLMRISYAGFCLKTKNITNHKDTYVNTHN